MVQVKKAFQIFKRDVKRLLKNPVALVITIGVCIIPSLYAWYNIVANWDPYGNTQGVRVAIANNDEGVENDLVGQLDAGAQTVEKLKENDKLGWVFTSSEEAKEGVESGEYYAAIVIPKDFSADLISMLTGEFDQPQLLYYVNEKKNAIAPKVTDTGAQTIEEQINETFVSTVSETLVEQMQAAAVQIDEHGDGAQSSLMRGVQQAATALDSVRSALGGTTGRFGEENPVGAIRPGSRAYHRAAGGRPAARHGPVLFARIQHLAQHRSDQRHGSAGDGVVEGQYGDRPGSGLHHGRRGQGRRRAGRYPDGDQRRQPDPERYQGHHRRRRDERDHRRAGESAGTAAVGEDGAADPER